MLELGLALIIAALATLLAWKLMTYATRRIQP